jgi:hypothetical protein
MRMQVIALFAYQFYKQLIFNYLNRKWFGKFSKYWKVCPKMGRAAMGYGRLESGQVETHSLRKLSTELAIAARTA